MSTQPKALALASELLTSPYEENREAAAELRRLHALNAQMLEALQNYCSATIYRASALVSGSDKLAHADSVFWSAHDNAQTVIAAAKGQS